MIGKDALISLSCVLLYYFINRTPSQRSLYNLGYISLDTEYQKEKGDESKREDTDKKVI